MSRNRGHFLPVLLTGCVLTAGCASRSGPDRTALSIRDFAHPPAGIKTDTLEMSPAVTAQPTITTEGTETIERDATGSRDFVEERRQITSKDAEGKTILDSKSPEMVARRIDPGQTWPVEGLVGQVNGRPVFADAFFNPIEDRLIAIAAMPDRAEARRALVAVVSREFKETVDSELVVADAESQLSP